MRVGREEGSSLPSPLGRRARDEGSSGEGRLEVPFSTWEKGGDEGSSGERRLEVPFSTWEKGKG